MNGKYRLSVIPACLSVACPLRSRRAGRGYRLSGRRLNHIAKTFLEILWNFKDQSPGNLSDFSGEYRKPNSEKGAVLIFTLVMLAVLSALTINLSSKMNHEILLLKNASDYLKASSLAKGGVDYAVALLKMDEDFEVDWLGEGWAEEAELTFDEGILKVNVTDESGKINLNYLYTGGKKDKNLRIEQMLELCDNIGLDYAVIAAIIDWIDGDEEIYELLSVTAGENKGAESEYYKELPIPYPCKNSAFDTNEEVMMVKGIERERYYGEEGLKNFVTVFSSGKININTAGEQVLKSTFQASLASSSEKDKTEVFEPIDDIAIALIMEWRTDNMISDISQLEEQNFFSEEVVNKIKTSGMFDFKSNFFKIESSAKVGKIEKNITVIVERSRTDIKIKYWNEN